VTRSDISPATRKLLVATLVVGLLHHTDHVLRVDHSGWPFRADVTPFTYSLAAYPMLLFALFGPPALFWLRWGLLAAGTSFTLFAHVAIESPQMQFAMWAYNRSLEPELAGVRNMCGVQSSEIGYAAVTISMALNVLLVTSTIAMAADRVRRSVEDARM
jgi:hypothetical protein